MAKLSVVDRLAAGRAAVAKERGELLKARERVDPWLVQLSRERPDLGTTLTGLVAPCLQTFVRGVNEEALPPEIVLRLAALQPTIDEVLATLDRLKAARKPEELDSLHGHLRTLCATADPVLREVSRVQLEAIGAVSLFRGAEQLKQLEDAMGQQRTLASDSTALVAKLKATQQELERERNSRAELELDRRKEDKTVGERLQRERDEIVWSAVVALGEGDRLRAASAAEVVDRCEKALAGVVARTRARVFASTSESYASQARAWRWAALGIFVVMVGGAIGLMVWNPAPPQDGEWTKAGNLAFLGTRVAIFTVLSFGLVSAVRAYRAAKHNEAINRHRAEAFDAFDLLKSKTSSRVGEVLELQAAAAMFGFQPTGFAEPGPPLSALVPELLAATKPIPGKDTE